MIKVGEIVNDFVLKDQHGKDFRLSDHKGKKVLLSFHPLAWTPVCAKQMEGLEAKYDIFEELNVVAVGISVDSTFCKRAWGKALGINRTRMLSDFWPHGAFSMKLGVFREGDGFSERANILLDEEGRVIFTKLYPISEVPDIEEIIDFIKKSK